MIQPTSKENRDAKVLLSDRSDMLAELAKAKEMIAELEAKYQYTASMNCEFAETAVMHKRELAEAAALLADAETVLASLANVNSSLSLRTLRQRADDLLARIRAVTEGKEG